MNWRTCHALDDTHCDGSARVRGGLPDRLPGDGTLAGRGCPRPADCVSLRRCVRWCARPDALANGALTPAASMNGESPPAERVGFADIESLNSTLTWRRS